MQQVRSRGSLYGVQVLHLLDQLPSLRDDLPSGLLSQHHALGWWLVRDLPSRVHAVQHSLYLLRVPKRPLPDARRMVRAGVPRGPLRHGRHGRGWRHVPYVPGELPGVQQRRGVHGLSRLHAPDRVQPVPVGVSQRILRERHGQHRGELQPVPIALQSLRDRDGLHRVRRSGVPHSHRNLRIPLPYSISFRGHRGRGTLLQSLPLHLPQLPEPRAVYGMPELHFPHGCGPV
mmetsp:Transcript_5611/g.12942  ORF Transcript_5611/g.12942 Transcript_5611/m.12942 type:complete len:231 (-) Transcript_5611:76-768(-)